MSIIADLHTHTKFSADARDDMADMCRAAITKGLSYICFTEHVDNNPNDESYHFFNYDKYSEAIKRVRDEFGDNLHILTGIEFGEPHLYQKEFESFLKKDFDVVMVGIHYIGEIGLHWFDQKYTGDKTGILDYTKQKIFRQYYEELLRAVKIGGFDVLAHFDNPKRYLKESGQEEELIDEIMHELVNAGIAIEINTSPLRRGYHECAPDSDILKRYIAAGGTKLTIGSDAHSCRGIAGHFNYASTLVQEHHMSTGIFLERRFITI